MYTFAGRQVPIFSYFSQHTPIFPIFFFSNFLLFFLFFSHFSCNVYLIYFFSGVSFQLFVFLKWGTPIIRKNFPASLPLALFCAHIIKKNYLDFCIWPLVDWDGCRSAGRQVKIQKICNLHQIINKYMNKVPIFSYFLCKIPILFLFSGITNSYFPIFLTIPIT